MHLSSIIRIVAAVLLGTIAAGAWTFSLDGGVDPGSILSKSVRGQPELATLEPGLIVDDRPLSGWSHLVIKSIPRLATGDLDTLPASASTTAGLFRTVILADVAPVSGGRPGFVLRRIGMGLCMPDRGQDRVVTTASLETLGISLATVPRLVLDRAEGELAQGRIVARTSTFALLLTPTNLDVGGEHRRVSLRYALLVDPETGHFRNAVWAPDSEPRRVVELPPSLVFDCGLDVAASRVFGRVPVSWSFAMVALPPGRSHPWPKGWPAGIGDAPLSPDEAASLERDLREALD